MKGGRVRIVLAIVALAALAATMIAWRKKETASGRGGGADGAAGETKTTTFHFGWPRGTAYAYAVRWKGDSRVSLPGAAEAAPFEAAYDIDGDLMLRSLGKKGDVTFLAAGLVRVGHHVFRGLGRDLVPDDDAALRELVHHTAWVEMGPDGVVRTVWLKKDDGDLWKIVAQSLLGHLTVTIPDAAAPEWVASEQTSTGRASTTYAWTPDVAPLSLRRTRMRYDQLAMIPGGACEGCREEIRAVAEIRLDPAGHVRTVDDDETFAAAKPATAPGTGVDVRSHDAFDLELKAVTHFDAPTDFELDRTSLEPRQPGVPAAGGDPARAMLEQRVGGLTWEQLETGIIVATVRGTPEPGLVSHASALVVQHPEDAAKLATLFVDPGTKPRAHALIADILASAGTPEAQAAMRDALGSEVAKSDPDYKLLVQRFTLLQRPDAKSAAFVAGSYDTSKAHGDDEVRFASAYALGAVSSKLAKQGDDSSARSYDAKLTADLARAKTAKERAILVQAVGGEGRQENVPLLRSYAHDTDPGVRSAVAGGLRSIDGPEVRSTLFDLLGDTDGVVQASALSSLDQRSIGPDDVRRLGETVRSGSTGSDLDSALVGFLAKHAGAGPEVRATLLAILARSQDPQLQARIRYVLGQLPAP